MGEWSKQNLSNHKRKQALTEEQMKANNVREAFTQKVRSYISAGKLPTQAYKDAIARTKALNRQLPSEAALKKLKMKYKADEAKMKGKPKKGGK